MGNAYQGIFFFQNVRDPVIESFRNVHDHDHSVLEG